MEILELLLELWVSLLPLLVAMLVGLVIGFEREFRDGQGSWRMFTLVAVSSCLFTLLAVSLGTKDKETVRLIAAFLTGVALLGAALIVRNGSTPAGVVNGVTMWLVAGLGILAGMSQFILLTTVVLLTLLALWVLPFLERLLVRRIYPLEFSITIKNSDAAEDDVLDIFDECKITILRIKRTRTDKGERTLHITAKMTEVKRVALSEILVNEKDILSFSV